MISKLIIRDMAEGGPQLEKFIRKLIEKEDTHFQILIKISSFGDSDTDRIEKNDRKSQIKSSLKLILHPLTNWIQSQVLSHIFD